MWGGGTKYSWCIKVPPLNQSSPTTLIVQKRGSTPTKIFFKGFLKNGIASIKRSFLSLFEKEKTHHLKYEIFF